MVYAKAPFGGPHAVIEYMGRYTHKVAISNHRITGIDEQDDTVSFRYKDYANENKQKQMTLKGEEFIGVLNSWQVHRAMHLHATNRKDVRAMLYSGEEKMSGGDGNTVKKTYFVDQSGATKAEDLLIVRL